MINVGRLAMRQEGENWNAYYSLSETSMDGAMLLGSILIPFVQNPQRKEEFIALMREIVADIIEEATGTRPVFPHPPHRAPEHERSGRA